MTARSRGRPPRGLSLIELMVAVAIACVLLLMGVPAFKGLLHARAQAAQIDTFTAALRFARFEAMRRGEQVSVCARDGTAAADIARCAPAGVTDWRSGWVVFVDRDERGRIDSGDQVLRVEQPLAFSGGIQTSRRYLTFEALGMSLNGVATFRFVPLLASADQTRLVCVNKPGRARALAVGQVCA